VDPLNLSYVAAAAVILIAGGIAALFVIRGLKALRSQDDLPDLPDEKKEKADFIIDAFGRVVQQLKEKEQELLLLRSQAERRASDAEHHNIILIEQMEMKKRLSLLGEMSAGIAHEFRNSLANILGYARLASKRLPEDDPGTKYLTAAIDEIAALNTIIQDLLNYGKPLTLQCREVDLPDLLAQTVEKTLQDRGGSIQARVDLPSSPVRVSGEPVWLRQVLANLIHNAADAMPGGGEIAFRLTPDDSGEWVELRVSDTGGGIPEEHIEKIFLPFFTTKAKGTGMGLALAHKIILAHGGEIRVERGNGRGTTFVILLPILKTTAPGPADRRL
jgi:signal transduction histidine kinase